jgi:hypothetical protein
MMEIKFNLKTAFYLLTAYLIFTKIILDNSKDEDDEDDKVDVKNTNNTKEQFITSLQNSNGEPYRNMTLINNKPLDLKLYNRKFREMQGPFYPQYVSDPHRFGIYPKYNRFPSGAMQI